MQKIQGQRLFKIKQETDHDNDMVSDCVVPARLRVACLHHQ